MGLRKLYVYGDPNFQIEAVDSSFSSKRDSDTIFSPRFPEVCRKQVTNVVRSSIHMIYWYRRNSGGHDPRTGTI